MFWGSAPEFLDLDYKIQAVSDHVTKFQGNASPKIQGGGAPTKNVGQNMQHFGQFCTTSDFDREYLQSINQSINKFLVWPK